MTQALSFFSPRVKTSPIKKYYEQLEQNEDARTRWHYDQLGFLIIFYTEKKDIIITSFDTNFFNFIGKKNI